MVEEVWQQLAAQGLTALLLGGIVFVLWRKLTALHVFYEGDPSQPEAKPGRIREMQVAAQVREDGLRTHYEGLINDEREAQAATLDELLSTLKGIK